MRLVSLIRWKPQNRVLEAAKALSTLPGGGDRAGFSLLGCCNSPTWELPLFLSMGGEVINGVPPD